MQDPVKRSVCVAVLMVFLVCMLSGCSTDRTEKARGADGTVTLTAMQYELENQTIDFQNLWYFEEIEKQTGVHVNFVDVKDSEWDTRLSLMFASGSFPDLILRGSLDVEEYGVSQHLVLPLDSYLADGLLPNYTQRLDEASARRLTSSDGHVYQLGFLISQNVNTSGHFFLNRAWLDALSLQMPATTDELLEVLRAFRDSDPNGNGLPDEIPCEATFDDNNTGIYNLFSFFGLPMNEEYVYVTDRGEVCFAPESEGFYPAAEFLHTLVSEQLLDVECITQGSNIWSAKVNTGCVGMFSYWRLGNTALTESVTKDDVLMIPVHAPGTACVLPRLIDDIEFGAAISSTCQNVEAALRWLDAQFETENMLISQNGPLGDTLRLREDGRYEVVYVPESNSLYKTVPVICGQFMAPSPWYESIYVPAAHRLEKSVYCAAYEEAGVLEPVSYKYLTNVAPKSADETARLNRLKNTLKSLIDQKLVEFMTQGISREAYDAFVRELRAAGSEAYRELYQTIYDRWEGSGKSGD